MEGRKEDGGCAARAPASLTVAAAAAVAPNLRVPHTTVSLRKAGIGNSKGLGSCRVCDRLASFFCPDCSTDLVICFLCGPRTGRRCANPATHPAAVAPLIEKLQRTREGSVREMKQYKQVTSAANAAAAAHSHHHAKDARKAQGKFYWGKTGMAAASTRGTPPSSADTTPVASIAKLDVTAPTVPSSPASASAAQPPGMSRYTFHFHNPDHRSAPAAPPPRRPAPTTKANKSLSKSAARSGKAAAAAATAAAAAAAAGVAPSSPSMLSRAYLAAAMSSQVQVPAFGYGLPFVGNAALPLAFMSAAAAAQPPSTPADVGALPSPAVGPDETIAADMLTSLCQKRVSDPVSSRRFCTACRFDIAALAEGPLSACPRCNADM